MACGRLTFLTIFVQFCAFLSANGHSKVIELNENNWREMLTGQWMVEFYAPWCPACKGLEPIWKEYATWSNDIGIKVAHIDVTSSPGLSGRFMVTALPTIFHVLNGEFRQYKGSRDKDALISFIEEKKWASFEPIPAWKSPTSVQMSAVSSFFRLSQVLRRIHNQLMEDFGLPTWGSYLIFAVATIILGAVLGLILVCCLDLVYPPKYSIPRSPDDKDMEDKKSDKGSGDELADEDIKDDLLDDGSQSEGERNSQSDDGDEKKSDSNDGDEKKLLPNDADEKNSLPNDGDEKNSQSESDSKNETPTQSNTNSPKLKKRKPRKE